MLAVLCSMFGISAFKLCYIIWFTSLLSLNVPVEDYFRKVSCTLNLISTPLHCYTSVMIVFRKVVFETYTIRKNMKYMYIVGKYNHLVV